MLYHDASVKRSDCIRFAVLLHNKPVCTTIYNATAFQISKEIIKLFNWHIVRLLA